MIKRRAPPTRPHYRGAMLVIIGVGAVLLILPRGFEFNNLNRRWTDDAYSSVIWRFLSPHPPTSSRHGGDTVVLLVPDRDDLGCVLGRYRRRTVTGATLRPPADPGLPHDLLGAAAVNSERIRDGFMWFFAHQLGSDATFQATAWGVPPHRALLGTIARPLHHRSPFGSWRIYARQAKVPG